MLPMLPMLPMLMECQLSPRTECRQNDRPLRWHCPGGPTTLDN